jgi:hypothetical protein
MMPPVVSIVTFAVAVTVYALALGAIARASIRRHRH